MDLMTKLAIGLGIMMGVVWLLIRNQPRREPQAPPPEPTPTARTLEEKLERLASIGWTLAPGITIDDLLHSFARPDYEQEGYDLLLVAMGSETEDERELVRCERVFHLDTECIERLRHESFLLNLMGPVTADHGRQALP